MAKNKIGVTITADDQASAKFRQLEHNAKRLSNRFKKIRSSTAIGVTKGLAIFHAIVATAQKLSGIVKAQDQNLSALKTATLDQSEFKKSTEYLDELSTKLPFSLDKLTKSFVFFRKKGLDPLNAGLVESMGDAAAALGLDLMQATNAVGHVMLGEFSYLKDLGIGSRLVGANGLELNYYDKKGREHLLRYRDRNNVKFIVESLKEILDDKYAGAAKNLATTWTGLFNRINSVFVRAVNTLVSSDVSNSLIKFFNIIVTGLENIAKNKTAITAFIVIKSLFLYIFDIISSIVNGVASVVKFLGKGFAKTFDLIMYDGLRNFSAQDLPLDTAKKQTADVTVSFNNLPAPATIETASSGLNINSEVIGANYAVA